MPKVATALRVPAVNGDTWVYLRAWNHYGWRAERTWAHRVGTVTADADHGVVDHPGLVCFRCNEGSLEANQAAIDEYLVSIGAEPVASGEWPDGCVGSGHRPDRPYGRAGGHVDEFELRRERRGSLALIALIAFGAGVWSTAWMAPRQAALERSLECVAANSTLGAWRACATDVATPRADIGEGIRPR